MADDRARALAAQRALQKSVDAFTKGEINKIDGTGSLGATVQLRVYKRRPPAFRRVPIEIVNNLTVSEQYRSRTNREIVSSIQARFPDFPVDAGLLDRKIEKYNLAEISGILVRNGTPLDLKVHNTLSRIKKALRGQAIRRQSKQQFSPMITFSDAAVVVGDRVYKVVVDAKGYPRITVVGQKVRADVLRALVSGSE